MVHTRLLSSIFHRNNDHRNPVDSQPYHEKVGVNSPKAEPVVVMSVDEVKNDGATTSSTITDDNPFSDPEVAKRYREIYEKARYECRRCFDPKLTWAVEEERQLVRRLDWHICLWANIMFAAMLVDHNSINQALSETFLEDLSLTTNDFNIGNSIFQAAFIITELPSQLLSKRLGPDRWTPLLMTTWCLVTMSQAALQNKTGFLVTRVLIGLLIGGFIPDVILWLSYFYTSRELTIRLGIFMTMQFVVGIITTFTGLGILHLRGVAGWPGWRWLFLLQNLPSLGISIASFFMMPPSLVQTKSWFRPKGWLTEREEAIAVNRILRDDPSKGDMHNRQAITPRRLWNALKDYDLWPLYVLAFFSQIPASPPNTYLVIILRTLGFNTYVTNLLTIPSTVAHIITLIGLTWLSERFKDRSIFTAVQGIWTLPLLITLRFWPGVVKNVWGTYALVTVLLSFPAAHAILVGWISKNSNSVSTRTMSLTIQNMIFVLGQLWAANIYVEEDRPLYHKGNTVLVILNILVLVLVVFAKFYYILRNRHRDRVWERMTPEERKIYIHHSKDVGTRRLDFRFAH